MFLPDRAGGRPAVYWEHFLLLIMMSGHKSTTQMTLKKSLSSMDELILNPCGGDGRIQVLQNLGKKPKLPPQRHTKVTHTNWPCKINEDPVAGLTWCLGVVRPKTIWQQNKHVVPSESVLLLLVSRSPMKKAASRCPKMAWSTEMLPVSWYLVKSRCAISPS